MGEPYEYGPAESEASSPFVSAPSSPRRAGGGSTPMCYYSAPASPSGQQLYSAHPDTEAEMDEMDEDSFEFSSRFSVFDPAPMSPAPMFAASSNSVFFFDYPVAARPPPHAALPNPPHHRRARSVSPLHFLHREGEHKAAPPPAPSSSSKRWTLKDLLHRLSSGDSQESGGGSSSKSSSRSSSRSDHSQSSAKKPTASDAKNRSAGRASSKKAGVSASTSTSAHELHYTMQRAQTEEMKKKTFLPYRQGLLGCLGFTSRSYGGSNISNISRTIRPIS